jgi:hypothetical protein
MGFFLVPLEFSSVRSMNVRNKNKAIVIGIFENVTDPLVTWLAAASLLRQNDDKQFANQ